MAEPDNHTLGILREVRQLVKKVDEKVDRNHEELRSRMDNIRQALNGESADTPAAEVEERLDAIEKRLKALEKAN